MYLTGCSIAILNQKNFEHFVKVSSSKPNRFNSLILIFNLLSEKSATTAECLRGSYFCESDFRNNFSIRREPDFYNEAVAACKNENSYLTSSNSASVMDYAKTGFNSFHRQKNFNLRTTSLPTSFKENSQFGAKVVNYILSRIFFYIQRNQIAASVRLENYTDMDKRNDTKFDSCQRWRRH